MTIGVNVLEYIPPVSVLYVRYNIYYYTTRVLLYIEAHSLLCFLN